MCRFLRSGPGDQCLYILYQRAAVGHENHSPDHGNIMKTTILKNYLMFIITADTPRKSFVPRTFCFSVSRYTY